jgi:thioredoxin 1
MVKEIPEVIFFRVDVNKCEDLVLEYNISCVPTFIFLKNGTKVAELFGAHEDQLRALIKQHK